MPLQVQAEHLKEVANVGQRNAPLVTGPSTRPLRDALIGVEGDERSMVEHRLAHHQRALSLGLHQYRPATRRLIQLAAGAHPANTA